MSFTEPQIADVIAEATKAYDGTDAAGLNNIKFFDASGNAVDIQESDFSISDVKYISSNAGTKEVKFTVKLNNDNYTFVNDDGTKTNEKEFTCTVTGGITKAALSSDIKAGTIDITNGNNGEYSFDLKTILPELTKPCEYGEVTYSTPTVSTESEGYNATAKIEGTNIKLNISSTGSENGRIGNVTVNVKSDNYQDFTDSTKVYDKVSKQLDASTSPAKKVWLNIYNASDNFLSSTYQPLLQNYDDLLNLEVDYIGGDGQTESNITNRLGNPGEYDAFAINMVKTDNATSYTSLLQQ